MIVNVPPSFDPKNFILHSEIPFYLTGKRFLGNKTDFWEFFFESHEPYRIKCLEVGFKEEIPTGFSSDVTRKLFCDKYCLIELVHAERRNMIQNAMKQVLQRNEILMYNKDFWEACNKIYTAV